jgi:two-component system, chemotaxis family, response regulator Rcp1
VFRILLAEDNPGDVLLFREALKSRDLPFELLVAEDGQKAIEMARKHASAGPGEGLDLAVLDVNLPKYNGDEILRQIRREPVLCGLPVVMLTSSSWPADEQKAGALGATLFLQKPSDLDQLLEIAKIIEGVLQGTRAGKASIV